MTDSSESTFFRYHSGEAVNEGDSVRTAYGDKTSIIYRYGCVEKVISPDSDDSTNWNCPQGGVLVVEDWDGTSNRVLWTPPDGIYWEDLEFIHRRRERKR
jgi:hypothetical protein